MFSPEQIAQQPMATTWHSLQAWLRVWVKINKTPPAQSFDDVVWATWIAANPVTAPRWMR